MIAFLGYYRPDVTACSPSYDRMIALCTMDIASLRPSAKSCMHLCTGKKVGGYKAQGDKAPHVPHACQRPRAESSRKKKKKEKKEIKKKKKKQILHLSHSI